MIFLVLHTLKQDLDDFQAPLGMFRHWRQSFEFNYDPRGFQFSRAPQCTFDDLFIIAPHLWHGTGVDSHWRQREIDFGINGATTDDHPTARDDWVRGDAEDEFGRIFNRESFVQHGWAPYE